MSAKEAIIIYWRGQSASLSAFFTQSIKAILLLQMVLVLCGCEVSGGSEGFDTQAYSSSSDVAVEGAFVERPAVDAERARLLELINTVRSEARACGEFGEMPAVEALTWNTLLEASARNTVDDMAAGNYFEHINPATQEDGGDRIRAVGYQYVRWGENLDGGYTTPESAIDALLESPTHCRILMRPYWREVAWFRRSSPEHGSFDVLGAQHFGISR